ncbi:hypothetical protein JJB09_18645 [Rhizobium sp. KVB221]|uniref:DUF4376 domain-containing protein n=1 Tax=Rhizobium setariae TaxID=2801340 RepID=A0A936YTE2_9HYPH|nr:DUF4376 domain-containing protein [Rhizobium setariae]MBL0374044.1 hypothetical protein [Rhizobium setariae]
MVSIFLKTDRTIPDGPTHNAGRILRTWDAAPPKLVQKGVFDEEGNSLPDIVTDVPLSDYLTEVLASDEDWIEGEWPDDEYMVDVATKEPHLGQPDRDAGQILRAIKVEHERRELAGKLFSGVHITGEDKMVRNLQSLASIAQLKIAQGDASTFTFKDGSDVVHEITWQAIFNIWLASTAYVTQLYTAKWALQTMEPIPADFADDRWWPSHTSGS